VRRAALLAAILTTVACRQLAGIQDLPKPCADPLMIDDMEDGDGLICASEGRHGGWFGFGDGSDGHQTLTLNAPIEGGRGASRKAVHFNGGGFTSWGAILGTDFNNAGISRDVYAAQSAGGLTFWMKSTAPVTAQLLLPATVLVADGGVCTATNDCNNHFGFKIAAPDSGWKQYQVPFTALRQWPGGTATWDPTQLLGLQFLVDAGVDFDIWVDDIAFYHCASTECLPTCTDAKFPVSCAKDNVHLAGCYPPRTVCGAIDSWCADPLLLDDMEDGDANICASGDRKGAWYRFGDKKALLEPSAEISGGRGDSNYAAHLSGTGLTDWGAGMGFTLNAVGQQPYDVSVGDGITFWMKAKGWVGVNFRRVETTPVATPPGTCTDAADCDHHFHFSVYATGDDWVEVRVPFTALTQSFGGSGRLSWDPTRILAIEFPASAPDVDIWVDDIRFYNCERDACLPTCNSPDYPRACPASGSYPAACWPAGTDCAHPPDIVNTGVWGTGSDDVWVVGYSYSRNVGTAVHWDGMQWTAAIGGVAAPIFAVWGSDATNVWTAGVGGNIRRRVGSNWVAENSGTTSPLYQGMWGSGPDDVWAAGWRGTIVHRDANGWTVAPALTTKDLWGLWGSGRDDAWAVGAGGTILRLTPSGWSTFASGTTSHLDCVWGSGANDVWAVGETVLHWNGGPTWTSVPAGTTKFLDGVWASGPNDAWAVGEVGTIRRWNGTEWRDEPSNTTAYLDAVWGSGPDDVYVGGELNTLLHWDGTKLSPVEIDWGSL
jgi:hypothetical protein